MKSVCLSITFKLVLNFASDDLNLFSVSIPEIT